MRAPDEAKPVVDFYTGISLEVGEIIIARNLINGHAREIRDALDGRNVTALKLAAEGLETKARQLAAMAGHLAGVTTKHINRRTRV